MASGALHDLRYFTALTDFYVVMEDWADNNVYLNRAGMERVFKDLQKDIPAWNLPEYVLPGLTCVADREELLDFS